MHWGRELLSAAGYFHSRSMLDDPLILKKAADDRGLRISSLSSHAPLAKPDVAVEYLRQSIRYAAEVGAPMIMVDDGPTPFWTTEDENYTLMRYTLQEAALVAEPRGIKIAIETHGPYTATPERLQKVMELIDSPVLTINLDTGNSYLSENDPHEWLEQIVGQVTHMHAKDISVEDARRLRGRSAACWAAPAAKESSTGNASSTRCRRRITTSFSRWSAAVSTRPRRASSTCVTSSNGSKARWTDRTGVQRTTRHGRRKST